MKTDVISFLKFNEERILPEYKILTIIVQQLIFDFLMTMRLHGYSEDEINWALQIVVAFRDQHQMPVID